MDQCECQCGASPASKEQMQNGGGSQDATGRNEVASTLSLGRLGQGVGWMLVLFSDPRLDIHALADSLWLFKCSSLSSYSPQIPSAFGAHDLKPLLKWILGWAYLSNTGCQKSSWEMRRQLGQAWWMSLKIDVVEECSSRQEFRLEGFQAIWLASGWLSDLEGMAGRGATKIGLNKPVPKSMGLAEVEGLEYSLWRSSGWGEAPSRSASKNCWIRLALPRINFLCSRHSHGIRTNSLLGSTECEIMVGLNNLLYMSISVC